MKVTSDQAGGAAGSVLCEGRGWSGPVEVAVEALRGVNGLMATVLRALADAAPVDGLSASRMVGLDASATGWDIRVWMRAVQVLDAMPLTWAAFDRQLLSWSQLRGIVSAARKLSRLNRMALDAALTGAIDQNATAEPDRLVELTEDIAGRLDEVAQTERESRALDRRSAVVQPAFDGGFTLYAELGPEGAPILEALDAAADAPVADDAGTVGSETADAAAQVDDDDRPLPKVMRHPSRRSGQLATALIRICQAFLGGDTGVSRPQALVIVDAHDLLDEDGTPAGGTGSVTSRLLWRMAGGRRRLTRLDARTLGCDASLVPIIVDDRGMPTAIGDTHTPIGLPLRRAVIARDQGCRMPGCGAPAQYCDAHHIHLRSDGGPTELSNLVMLCRRCHRKVHKHRWRLQLYDDGRLTVGIGRRTYTSRSRLKPPPPTRHPPDAVRGTRSDPDTCVDPTALNSPKAANSVSALPF